jgi:hypothetical protein
VYIIEDAALAKHVDVSNQANTGEDIDDKQ